MLPPLSRTTRPQLALTANELVGEIDFQSLDETALVVFKNQFTIIGQTEFSVRELMEAGDFNEIEGQLVVFEGNIAQTKRSIADLNENNITRLDDRILIVHNGQLGLFTARDVVNLEGDDRMTRMNSLALIVTEGHFGLFSPRRDSSDNGGRPPRDEIAPSRNQEIIELKERVQVLEERNDELRDALHDAQQENLQLKETIREMQEATRRTPEDFATAVSHSVDNLQLHLSQMTNNISNFVVREFDLDARVYIDVNDQGKIDYRFIQPGDKVQSEQVSNLKLKLVPIPRDATATHGEDNEDTDTPAPIGGEIQSQALGHGASRSIAEISSIDSAWQSRLHENDIFSVADLLTVATRARGIVELSAQLDVERDRLALWLSQAQLLIIPDISARNTQILMDLNIISLEQLSNADAHKLTELYNAAANQRKVPIVPIGRVQGWIDVAGQMMSSSQDT